MTFVIPARNAAATIAETLESVRQQTDGRWRAIIVDDRSDDQTRSIAEAYLPDRRFSLMQGPAQGAAAARNAGGFAVTSPWTVFLDSDDLIRPDYVAAMLARATGLDPAKSLIYCYCRTLAADGTLGPIDRPPRRDHALALTTHSPFKIHTVMMPSALFAAAGGFDPDLAICEDWDLWTKLFKAGAIAHEVSRPMAIYRMQPGSLVRNAALFMRCAEVAVDRARAAFLPQEEANSAEGLRQRANHLASLGLWALGLSIGAGAPDLSVAGDHRPAGPLDVVYAAMYLQFGLATGACRHITDWPKLAVEHADMIRVQLAALAGAWQIRLEIELLCRVLTGQALDGD